MVTSAQKPGFIPRYAAEPVARGARQLGHAVIGELFPVVVLLLFAVSSGMLGALGINHGGITGSVVSKIHPVTYLSLFMVVLIMVACRNPASFFAALITRQPGTFIFLITILMLAAYIVLDGRKGIATVFDTFLLAVAVALIAAEARARDLVRAEKLIHVLLAANAALRSEEHTS